MCLSDSSSALDTVWHNGLFYKLYHIGVKVRLWLLLYNLCNWYEDMVANIVLHGKMSRDIQIKQSVRQGSILGPWLYMLCIHDLAVQAWCWHFKS